MYLVGSPPLQRWGTRMGCRSASPTAKAIGHPRIIARVAIDRLGYTAIVLGVWKGNSSCVC